VTSLLGFVSAGSGLLAVGVTGHWSSRRRDALGRDEVIAVHVLTHEAMHMRGETNEATAECEAVQRDRTTAALLGATPRQADELARTYWLTVYPDMPADYSSAECRPGGALDEGLTTAAWLR
jgi:hypothetical protein